MQWSFGNDGDTRNRLGHMNIRPYAGLPQPCDPDPSVPCERHTVQALNYPTSWNGAGGSRASSCRTPGRSTG